MNQNTLSGSDSFIVDPPRFAGLVHECNFGFGFILYDLCCNCPAFVLVVAICDVGCNNLLLGENRNAEILCLDPANVRDRLMTAHTRCIFSGISGFFSAIGTDDDFRLEPKQILQPLLFRDSHFVFAHDFLAESLDKGILNICRHLRPSHQEVIVYALYRTVGRILGVGNENRGFAIIALLSLFRHDSLTLRLLALQRVVSQQQQEKDNGKRKLVSSFIRRLSSYNDRWCHVSAFSSNPGLFSKLGNVVVIADQDISGFRVQEEVAVIQILIGESTVMQNPETLYNVDGCIQQRVNTGKINLSDQEIREVIVVIGAQLHNVAKCIVVHTGDGNGPQE